MNIRIVTRTGLVAAAVFAAQPCLADGEKIAEIAVQGNRRIESSAVINAAALKIGDALQAEQTDAAVKAVFRLGHFQDVQLLTEQHAAGVRLILAVTEKPIVREILFEGTKEVNKDKLLEGMPLRKNSIFSQKDLDRSVAKIKKYYQDEGYYLVEIKPVIDQKSPMEYQVTFNITEGKKVRISTIRFDGLKAYSPRKIRGVMETKEEWFMSWLTGAGTYKEEVLRNDALLIEDFYLNNGYINVKVGEPVLKLADDKSALFVDISITEGDQYRIGQIDFKGDLLHTDAELRQKLKSLPGEVFSRANIRADIGQLTDMVADKGYAFNNVNPRTKPDQQKKMLDITFDFEKGEQVTIERIYITGNAKTRDKVARREMRLMEGELYSATGFKRSKQNLMNTGYFEEANVSTVKGSSSNKLDVKVDLKEKPTGAFTIGGGYSSLDGMVFQGSVSQSNFLGLGLKASASAAIGGKSNTYSLGLTDPYFLDTKWTIGGDVYRSEREYTDYDRRLTGFDFKAGYPLSDNLSIFTMYKYEIKDIYAIYNTAILQYPEVYNIRLGTKTTSAIHGSLTHNDTDYRFDPSSGMVNSISLEYAGIGGDNKYARAIVDNTFYKPLWWKLVGSTRIVLGTVNQVGGAAVDMDEKFYLGGIGTLRGYSSRSVSPFSYSTITIDGVTSSLKVNTGGSRELFGNAEIKFPLIPESGLKGVAFFDYGNAWESGLTPPRLQMSYGAGIRWASPMGPLRLEYGIPINPRAGIDSASGRFEFAIGSMF